MRSFGHVAGAARRGTRSTGLAQKGWSPGNIVVGNSVNSLGFVRGVTSGLEDLAGGEIASITELISDGRHAAIGRLVREATDHGAHGLTGVTSELKPVSNLMEFPSPSARRSAARITRPVVLLDGLLGAGPLLPDGRRLRALPLRDRQRGVRSRSAASLAGGLEDDRTAGRDQGISDMYNHIAATWRSKA
ncbi:MAG: heavy metal-binding domain-containing protein [Isosphaeraceae bacterium]